MAQWVKRLVEIIRGVPRPPGRRYRDRQATSTCARRRRSCPKGSICRSPARREGTDGELEDEGGIEVGIDRSRRGGRYVSGLLGRLRRKEQRGSKPRCHWMTHGPANQVAAALSALAAPWATVLPTDRWMPEGFDDCEEAQLHRAPRLLDPAICRQLGEWSPADRQDARTPNFDIASTCTIEGRPGLLLVEAKAHAEELRKEAAGRKVADDVQFTDDRKASHETIKAAIDAARVGLGAATGLTWGISRDSHYQMSNRFGLGRGSWRSAASRWSWSIWGYSMPRKWRIEGRPSPSRTSGPNLYWTTAGTCFLLRCGAVGGW